MNLHRFTYHNLQCLLLWIITSILFSCNGKKDNFNYETNIASLTYKAELNYLNTKIKHYSNLSDSGYFILKQNSILDEKILGLRKELAKEGQISSQKRDTFFNYFERTLKDNAVYLDLENLEEFKKISIENLSDIDLLGLYLKRSLVARLTDNKLLPFDTWSIMATVDKWRIKDGEEFKMQMNTTASNSKQPAEWYILKDESKGFTTGNILDTLHVGEFGETTFKTTRYHKGENQITVLVKLKTINGEKIVEKMIEYTVE